MATFLTEQNLENKYQLVQNKLKTGLDKIDNEKFESIRESQYPVMIKKIKNGTYKFTRFKYLDIQNGSRRVYIPTIRDRLVLELLKDRLAKKYRVTYTGRDEIVNILHRKLTSGMPFFVIRLDIKNFFGSLPKNLLLQKLREKSLLSIEEYDLISKSLHVKNEQGKSSQGVPQGLPISNILSEIYLEKLDFQLMRIHPRVNYCTRYVDDIILLINGFLTKTEISELETRIYNLFRDHFLKINSEKILLTHFWLADTSQSSFDFLGYHFGVTADHQISVTISNKKIEKYKTKIRKCFDEFRVKRNFYLLNERLKYLTRHNIFLRKEGYVRRDNKVGYRFYYVNASIFDSYKLATDCTEKWKELDQYLKHQIMSVKKFIRNREQLRELHTHSFSLNQKRDKRNFYLRYTKKRFVQIISKLTTRYTTHQLESFDLGELTNEYFTILNI